MAVSAPAAATPSFAQTQSAEVTRISIGPDGSPISGTIYAASASDDGRWAVIVTTDPAYGDPGDNMSLVLVDVAGGVGSRVGLVASYYGNAPISADGSTIAYRAKDEHGVLGLYVMDRRTLSSTLVVDAYSDHMIWANAEIYISADGRYLMGKDGAGQGIWFDTKTGLYDWVIRNNEGYMASGVPMGLSSDGKTVFFASGEANLPSAGDPADASYPWFSRNVDLGTTQKLPPIDVSYMDKKVSANGKKFGAVTWNPGVEIVDLPTGERQDVALPSEMKPPGCSNNSVEVSNDATKLIVWTCDSQMLGRNLWSYDTDTGNSHLIASGIGVSEFSPFNDARGVVFSAPDENGLPAAYIWGGVATVRCGDAAVLGVRGSGDATAPDYPGGAAVAVAKLLQDDWGLTLYSPSHSVEGAIGLAYPASPVWEPWLYQRSVQEGVANMRTAIQSIAQECGPDFPVLLVGYSQGANVIQDFLSGIAPESSTDAATLRAAIRGVAIFASPKFDPFDPGGRGTFYDDSAVSILGQPTKIPNTFSDRSRTYCLSGDVVCDGPTNTWAVHENAYALGQLGDAVVRDAAGFLRSVVSPDVLLPTLGTSGGVVPRSFVNSAGDTAPFTKTFYIRRLSVSSYLTYGRPGVTYEWDWNNDGVIDAATNMPWVNTDSFHLKRATGSVRVVDAFGRRTQLTFCWRVAGSTLNRCQNSTP